MKLSVAIPAFNRPFELKEALESLASECSKDIEIVISEDHSPLRDKISKIVKDFALKNPSINLIYISNSKNLGYDANIRSLLYKCTGKFIFFMGDDDKVLPGALKKILKVTTLPNIGLILRSWESFDGKTGKTLDAHHYFRGDRIFAPSIESASALFRRSVFISGLTFNRLEAKKFSTNKFDGTLLYQLYLVGNLLKYMNGYYLDEIITRRRSGGVHFFGSSKSESNKFKPKELTSSHSLAFIKGFYKIANFLELLTNILFCFIIIKTPLNFGVDVP
jgi:glycosyltransferase involved in cell wall biosynthesis